MSEAQFEKPQDQKTILSKTPMTIAIIALMLSLGTLLFVIFTNNQQSNISTNSILTRINDLDVKNREQAIDIMLLKFEVNKYSSCVLDPTQLGPFQMIFTSCGMFFVSLQNVEPYLNGVKIHLRIGNPMMASYNGATLKIKYGNVCDPNFYDKWLKSIKNVEVKITDQLNPGRWNETTAVLSNIQPADFGYLELSMETENLSLLVPYPKQQ